jgi:SOS response regulatory protein OraA/RecX
MPAPDALDVAVQALARRDLTEREVVERLARLGVPEGERADVIARLRLAGYLDDARVTAERAARLADRGSGDAAIRADLARRGVPAELVTQTLATLEPESVRAARLSERLGGGLRAARALARKGFATESIEHALGPIAEQP